MKIKAATKILPRDIRVQRNIATNLQFINSQNSVHLDIQIKDKKMFRFRLSNFLTIFYFSKPSQQIDRWPSKIIFKISSSSYFFCLIFSFQCQIQTEISQFYQMLSVSFQDSTIDRASINYQPKNTIEQNQEYYHSQDPSQWAKGNFMKGNKLSAQQIRKKHALKTQNITHSTSKHNTYFQQPGEFFDHNEGFFNEEINDETITHTNQTQKTIISRRNGYSADPTFRNRRKRVKEELENIRSRTMMITSSYSKSKRSSTVRNFHMFNSSNLGTRMNEYMNLFIRQGFANMEEYPQTLSSSLNSKKINAPLGKQVMNFHSGIVPHKKQLGSFQRKIKYSKKLIPAKGHQFSGPREDVANLSKTLNFQIFKSPLVNSLQHKNAIMLTVRSKKKGSSQKQTIF